MVSILQRFLVLSNRQKSLIVLIAFFTMFLGQTSSGLSQPGDFGLIRPSNYSEDVDVWPVFEWESTPTPNCTYTLQISTDPQFSEGNYVEYDSLITTMIRPPVDLLMGQTLYYWRVKAVDSDGNYTWNNADQYPYNYWTLQTIPATEPREIIGGGYLNYDRTLIPENSPYTMVQGDLTIGSNSLTIRAGVTVEIDGSYGIDVLGGGLRMLATEEDSITVTKKNGNPGYWRDIRFPAWCSPDSVVFEYINFTYAGSEPDSFTVNAPNTKVIIKNCVFKNCNNGAIKAGENSRITDNEIRNVKRGIHLAGNNSRVENNTLTNLTGGSHWYSSWGSAIFIVNAGSSWVKNNFIQDVAGFGIKLESGLNPGIINNTIDSCGFYGIHIENSPHSVIENNRIAHCNGDTVGGGIYCSGDSCALKNNTVTFCQVSTSSEQSGSGGGICLVGNYLEILGNYVADCSGYIEERVYDGVVRFRGGGICVYGNYTNMQENEIDSCFVHVLNSSQGSTAKAEGFGGGVCICGQNNTITGNQFTGNYIWCHSSGSYSRSYGGGLCLSGDDNTIRNNLFSDNYLIDTGNYGYGLRYGAGVYLDGLNTFSNNTIINNDAQGGCGGGIYVKSEYTLIDSCSISGNRAGSGGGIKVYWVYPPSADRVKVDHCTITNNYASHGGGIWGGKWIYNSIIKYNQIGDTTNAGGIYGDPISLNYNNINHNQGYQLKKSNSSNTDATNNWWFTRSDQIQIENGIWDGHDQSGLGFATYQPFLTDVSPAIPGVFENASYIIAKDDSTYSSDLSHPLTVGDTLFFELGGEDSNPYTKNVVVISVFNKNNWNQIRPFYEETGDSTGIWHCEIYLAEQTQLPRTIRVSEGDTLRVAVEVDPSVYFDLIVGAEIPPSISHLDIGGSEDIEHLVTHHPLITWSYSDPGTLAQDAFQVQVGTDDDWAVAEMWDSGEVSSADTFVTYAGDSLIDGETYYLRAGVKNTQDLWSSWASLSFRMNSTPSTPVVLSPREGEVISDSTVALVISNSTDAEGDSLTYGFEVYSDSLLGNLVTSATGVEEGIDSTIWLIDVPLEDNHQYWWRARADDGFEDGEWISPSSFIINSENDPPGSFHLLTPPDGGEVTTLKPILDWETSIDPDPGDQVTYTLFYGKDIPSQLQVEVGGESVYQIKTPLEDNQLYYWKVVAKDLAGATEEDEEGYQTFITNTANEDPNSFNLVTPTWNSVEVDLTPIFYWENATDNDIADSIHYLLYVDQDSNFSGTIPTVVDSNCYIPAEELADNSQYFWKVVAIDKESLSTSTDTWRFFTNVALEPPNPFSLIEPELGIDSVSTTPTFLWHKATDNDLWDYATYKLYLSPDSTFSQGVIGIYPADTHFTVPPGIPLNDNTRYYWKVVAMDTDSLTTWGSNSDISPWWFVVGKEGVREREGFGIPQAFSLSQNFPNPFNPATEIRYALPRATQVRLEIYNLLGQKVATLVDEYQRAGYRSVRWDAGGLASGVYLYRLQVADFTAVKKLVVIK